MAKKMSEPTLSEKPSEEQLDTLLRYDVLDALGGNIYTTQMTMALGAVQMHAEAKKLALKANSDTYWNMPPNEFRNVALDLGFRIILKGDFTSVNDDEEEVTDHWFIAYRPGCLLFWDTYRGEYLNKAKLYFNWKPNEGIKASLHFNYSGGVHDGVLTGDIDAREALRHSMSKFLKYGTFVSPWTKRPFLWLVEYTLESDSDDFDVDAVNQSKIERLPEEVQTMIGGQNGNRTQGH